MCGICGKLQFRNGFQVEKSILNKMMDAITHRGPDGRGSYTSGPVGLGHTRLSIIDLNTGAQPMCNEDKTVWIVFNGEIYNFPELRDQLAKKGHIFSSATDTEVIIHLYEEYGVECLQYLRGMFAFAIWDEKDRSLFLARDRVGIKPIYYSNTGTSFIFGSEIKVLLADPEVRCEVFLPSIDKFLTHLCLPGKETLWKNIYKLEPGHYLFWRGGKLVQKEYWDLRFTPVSNLDDLGEASEALYGLLKETVRDHMISDVPVGFLLSGGVDSTVILSCAAAETNKRPKTFTVGFNDKNFEDERPYAKLAASYLNTEHHEITITPSEFWDYLPKLVWHMEEPVCDPPAVALHYVSKLASNHVKVLLSGEGGDEAFGGYYTYRNFLLLERMKSLLGPLKSALPSVLKGTARFGFKKAAKYEPFSRAALQSYYYSRASSPFSYFNKNKKNLFTAEFRERSNEPSNLEILVSLFEKVRGKNLLDQMQYIDIKTLLPDDLLIKADRITMGNSLELRVPFLDHKVMEFGVSLPPRFRVHGSQTKRILKNAFGNRIPKEIIKRRKAGFPIPIERWTQNELKAQVREVLLSPGCLKRGYFQKKGIEDLLNKSEQGADVAKEMFALLTLELLLVRFSDPRS
jgi:asparagine synthase (glutamine-hydrolysing)